MLRNYVDRIFNETSKVKKQRVRVYDKVNFYDTEKSVPTNAPKWSIHGYKGSLYDEVKRICSQRFFSEQIQLDN